MRAYKVLKKRLGKLQSCIVKGNYVAVTYVQGKPVYAPKWLAKKGYHLCIFRRVKEARNFAINHDMEDRIWLVNARGIILDLPPILNLDVLSQRRIEAVGGGWPFGTIMGKSLTLVRKIKGRRKKR